MGEKTSVTIIIPAYNMSQYIDKCINSLEQQTYGNFKVIIIDDGSTDDTYEKAKTWERKDSRIQAMIKAHAGQGCARNYGLGLVTTEYVTFLDADDTYDKTYLEEMINASQEGTIDIVVCDMMFVFARDNGVEEKVSKIRFLPGEIDIRSERFYLSKSRTFLAGKLIRKDIFNKYKIEQPSHPFEDIAMVPYMMAKAKRISYVDKPLYRYLRNRNNSTINDFEVLAYTVIALRELLDLFQQDGTFERYKKELCYLFWGQVCHVWNVTNGKFCDADQQRINNIRNEMYAEFKKNFPKMKGIQDQKYYINISNNIYIKVVEDALKNISITQECISDFAGKTNIIIDDADIEDVNMTEEFKTVSWNLSDVIFEKIMVKAGM